MLTTMRDSVGRRLKRLRQEVADRTGARFTQTDLARAIGATKSTVAKWETDVQVPNGRLLVELARALGTTPAYLLTGEQEERPEDAVHDPRELAAADLPFEDETAGVRRLLEHSEGIVRRMTGANPDVSPEELRLRKLDALEGLRLHYQARGMPTDCVYDLRARVVNGTL